MAKDTTITVTSEENLMKTNNYKVTFEGIDNVIYQCQGASLPSIQNSAIPVAGHINDIYVPDSKIVYNPWTIEFMVDETLTNYFEISQWMYRNGFPQSTEQFREINHPEQRDAFLIITSNKLNSSRRIHMHNVFPTDLSELQLNERNTTTMPVLVNATFQIDYYTIEEVDDV